ALLATTTRTALGLVDALAGPPSGNAPGDEQQQARLRTIADLRADLSGAANTLYQSVLIETADQLPPLRSQFEADQASVARDLAALGAAQVPAEKVADIRTAIEAALATGSGNAGLLTLQERFLEQQKAAQTQQQTLQDIGDKLRSYIGKVVADTERE